MRLGRMVNRHVDTGDLTEKCPIFHLSRGGETETKEIERDRDRAAIEKAPIWVQISAACQTAMISYGTQRTMGSGQGRGAGSSSTLASHSLQISHGVRVYAYICTKVDLTIDAGRTNGSGPLHDQIRPYRQGLPE